MTIKDEANETNKDILSKNNRPINLLLLHCSVQEKPYVITTIIKFICQGLSSVKMAAKS